MQSLAPGAEIDHQAEQSFVGIYEPSGLIHLGEDEFILIEDEADHPFFRLKKEGDGRLNNLGEIDRMEPKQRLNDLEGITFDGEYVYVITSHSLTKKGKQGKGRSVLARYHYRDGKLFPAGVVKDLKSVLIRQIKQQFPSWSEKELIKQLNVEALSWSPESLKLYIGLRAPVITGKSLVISVASPAEIFEQESAKQSDAQLHVLDLGGVGIRAMTRDDSNRRFMIVAGDKKKGDGQFAVWSWSPQHNSSPMFQWEVKSATEGITISSDEGNRVWISLRDDGKRKKDRPAHYQAHEELH